ncbi:NAD-dependent epimerase/dehydratase family protein [Nocardioides sp. 616]|uniref:NAD-dependent epimerase/dehydratase family protein n=1 Tax=Nocardioides sp. 616 TaxID=2268090 RepID=UPI000CE43636|nr:NAD-dependent epimerase/dehydratase family protein [Nocardioides sp. 616]
MEQPHPPATPGQHPADVLLVGCGDLGADVGLRLARQGHRVLALRRRAELVPAPLVGLGVDLTRETPTLPPPESMDLRLLVVALTARPRTEEAYRATYVDGMARALDALDAAGQRVARAVLVSSTGVYGDAPGTGAAGELVDEDVPARPADGPARMLLAAEELFAARVPGGTVLRLSGLYGRGSARLLEQVRTGSVGDPDRWTNRIHREDAAAAVVHLLTRAQQPDPLYVGTDDEPALLGDVAAYLASLLGVPAPAGVATTVALGTGRRGRRRGRGRGKRLSNARLRATGWEPAYPTYREGYAAGSVR